MDVGDLVKRIADDFSTLACESGASVQARTSGSLYAECDPDRIRQALAALIDNALRHTRQGVNVIIETLADGNAITVTVIDDGPGIDPQTATELFSRFRRGEARGDGSGLGLTVVRALAEAHGGTASIGNAAQGGARAELRLPRVTAEPSRAVA